MTDCERDRRYLLATLDAARASQPITATDPGIWRDLLERAARMGSCSQTHHEFIARDARLALNALAALPVREDEPTGIDEEHCCNDPDHMSAEYLALIEASHVR